ncbi:MAG: threonine--tRNA ligase [Thermoproteales archaeon]|nr:threonine--tRNA ligase [Thermoproteales archaeon]
MRVLLLHCDWIEYEPRKKALEEAEEIKEGSRRLEEVLAVFITVEKDDEEEVVERASTEILNVFHEVKAERILLYPWAHLSSRLKSPDKALYIIKLLEKKIKGKNIEVYRAPFGWYKALRLSVKGHPLAELSREIRGEGEEKTVAPKVKKKYVIVTPEGREIDPVKADLSSFNPEFQVLVRKEALGEKLPGGKSTILDYLKRFEFEWEPFSDYGHMRLGPYAALIFDLVSEYSREIAGDLGVPLFEVKGTAFFDLKMKPVREHAELYGDRLYTLKTDKGEMILRYAACHQQFALIKDWNLSYRNLPFGAFEVADSYRYEQSGETELCFRLRRFYMPDLHIFVKDEDEAKKWLLRIHEKIMDEMKKLGRNYELLVNVVTPQQYDRYRSFIVEIAQRIKKPLLVAIYPASGLSYYWTINIEYHILDLLGRPREVGTVQIDIGNAKRFGIKYVGENGEEKYPVILHTAIIGSIERFIYAVFDTALHKKRPMLPVWLSPIQVRILPVSSKHLPYANEIALKLESLSFRVDIDDTERSLSRKIVDAEREWIPYILVVGDKEYERRTITVRRRKDGRQVEMTVNELIEELQEETRGYPRRRAYFGRYVSLRPGFIKWQ